MLLRDSRVSFIPIAYTYRSSWVQCDVRLTTSVGERCIMDSKLSLSFRETSEFEKIPMADQNCLSWLHEPHSPVRDPASGASPCGFHISMDKNPCREFGTLPGKERTLLDLGRHSGRSMTFDSMVVYRSGESSFVVWVDNTVTSSSSECVWNQKEREIPYLQECLEAKKSDHPLEPVRKS
jgi:hypothetical protein